MGTTVIGAIIGVQSIIGIFILLPQATFIHKFGEMTCVKLGIFANAIIYFLYSSGYVFFVYIGKFAEGFADRLLNSSISKLVYDYTDNTNNSKFPEYIVYMLLFVHFFMIYPEFSRPKNGASMAFPEEIPEFMRN